MNSNHRQPNSAQFVHIRMFDEAKEETTENFKDTLEYSENEHIFLFLTHLFSSSLFRIYSGHPNRSTNSFHLCYSRMKEFAVCLFCSNFAIPVEKCWIIVCVYIWSSPVGSWTLRFGAVLSSIPIKHISGKVFQSDMTLNFLHSFYLQPMLIFSEYQT